jgi:hypothetical protein
LHQVGDLFELNVKVRCQKVNTLKVLLLNLSRTVTVNLPDDYLQITKIRRENEVNSISYQTAYYDGYMKLSTNYRNVHYQRSYNIFIPLSKFQFCPSFKTFLTRVTQQILSFVR